MTKFELRLLAETAAKLVEITKCPAGEASGLKHYNIGTKGTKHVGKRTYGHGNKRLWQPA